MSKEKPILFSPAMIKAILNGIKTQTRRIIKPQPNHLEDNNSFSELRKLSVLSDGFHKYGNIGDYLYVKETYYASKTNKNNNQYIYYKADTDKKMEAMLDFSFAKTKIKWKSSLFMPKKYSRIKLEITDIRIERLQDITEKDAINEGLEISKDANAYYWYKNYLYPKNCDNANYKMNPIKSFQTLWDNINAKKGFSFSSNPFVYVISFKQIKPS